MVPIRDVVIFPFTKVAFKIGRPGSVRALEMALASDRTIFLSTQHDATVDEPTPELVNDLDVRVETPSGATLYPNGGVQPDRLNNVEMISIPQPATGAYTVTVSANHLGAGPRQGYALVMTGDFASAPVGRARAVRF